MLGVCVRHNDAPTLANEGQCVCEESAVTDAHGHDRYITHPTERQLGDQLPSAFLHACDFEPQARALADILEGHDGQAHQYDHDRHDREQLNQAFWLGLGTPGSTIPADNMPESPGGEWRKKWSTFDKAKANAMLDAIGLTKKDSEGYRVRTDNGERLRIQIDVAVTLSPTWPAHMLTTITLMRQMGKTIVTLEWAPVEPTAEERATFDAAREAISAVPGRADVLNVLLESAAALKRHADAADILRSAVGAHQDIAELRVALSKLYASNGDFDGAVSQAVEAVQRHPDDGAALEQLASIFADVGDAARLAPLVAELTRFPERPGAHYYRAAERFMQGDLGAAKRSAEDALKIDPRYAKAENLLGAVFATAGDMASARRAFQSALLMNPEDPATYQNLAKLEMNAGNTAAAERLFAEALWLDPGSEQARAGLVAVRGGS